MAASVRLLACLVALIGWLCRGASGLAAENPISTWRKKIVIGYNCRVAADPRFLHKSLVEALLAAGTQFSAEWQRRGHLIFVESDFVLAGVLTAVAGKYYSMWKVAKTMQFKSATYHDEDAVTSSIAEEPRLFNMQVPTNAFQKTMIDGVTRPSLRQRFGSVIAPMAPLFTAGIFASGFGYGLTAVMIQLRSILVPSYVAATQNVNILYASLYTGVFMAIVSNLRYQILQGAIEPGIEYQLQQHEALRETAIFVIRIANGLLGSMLAIAGMQWVGLQRLK